MKIMEMSEDERPREKMRSRGLVALSNVELLSVIMRTGMGGRNVMDIARELFLSADQSLCRLSSFSPDRMCKVQGIGFGKAASVVAAFELGRRCAMEQAGAEEGSVTDSETAYRIMAPYMRVLDHEESWAIFLNRSNRLIGRTMIGSGGLHSTPIDARLLAGMALERKATGVILVHNHPSGSPVPSDSDIRQTMSVRKALGALNILLLDHIVVGGDSFYSFTDECYHKRDKEEAL